jgi:uncharacterized protein (TIGR02611 family)
MKEAISKHTKKVIIGIVGGFVAILGLVLVPYPGPGWLIVFAGLAILATEFVFAQKALDNLKHRYEKWQVWLKQQHVAIQISVLLLVGLLTVVTVYLVNGFGVLNAIFNLNLPWLISPLVG